jgi:hypothetical protein
MSGVGGTSLEGGTSGVHGPSATTIRSLGGLEALKGERTTMPPPMWITPIPKSRPTWSLSSRGSRVLASEAGAWTMSKATVSLLGLLPLLLQFQVPGEFWTTLTVVTSLQSSVKEVFPMIFLPKGVSPRGFSS